MTGEDLPLKPAPKKVSLFVPSLRGGGAEKVVLSLAGAMAEQNLEVDLVLAQRDGAYVAQVPRAVRVVDLKSRRVLTALPGLIHYLRERRPDAMLSALPHANVMAVIARSLASVDVRLVLSEHSTTSLFLKHVTQRRARLLPAFMRLTYPKADSIVAVSDGVAEDLAVLLGLERSRIGRIYNPVVAPRLFELAAEPLQHPWFLDGAPPVILGAGRLTAAKDFRTLIEAFAIVRRDRQARLMILGEGGDRRHLEALADRLGIAADVSLPGFAANPYKFMSRSSVFVLSSRWEGFGIVLVEAMACGVPVVSTDCPSGPTEILEAGQHGRLVPVGDARSMARAITAVLDGAGHASAVERACTFTLTAALNRYREVLAV